MSTAPHFNKNLLVTQKAYASSIRSEALPSLNHIGIFINVTKSLLDTAKERSEYFKINPNSARPLLSEDQRPLSGKDTVETLNKCKITLNNFPSSHHIDALKEDISALLAQVEPTSKPTAGNNPLRNNFLSRSRTPQPMARRMEAPDGQEQIAEHMSPPDHQKPNPIKVQFAKDMSRSPLSAAHDKAVNPPSAEEIERQRQLESIRRFLDRGKGHSRDRSPSRSR